MDGVDIISLTDLDPIPDYDEVGDSYEEIATNKAKYYAEKSRLMTIADDSGLFISAFPDQFGIMSRRQFGPIGNDDIEWLRLFLELMENEEDQSGAIQTTLCFYNPADSTTHIISDQLTGDIEAFPQAPIPKGGPFDTVFIPTGADDVLANLPEKWLNTNDPRTRAAQKMSTYLQTFL